MTKKKELSLTLKQRKWIKEYIKTGNATEAASRVYDCKDRNVANAIGAENLAKLSMPELMEEMGLSDVALINVGMEGLQASKQLATRIVVKNPVKSSTQAGELIKATEQTDDFVEVPDYSTRHKYWDTLLKLKGKLGEKDYMGMEFKEGDKSVKIIVSRGNGQAT